MKKKEITLIIFVFVCLQSCEYEVDEIDGHDEISKNARKKLICAAVLSVVFMVRIK